MDRTDFVVVGDRVATADGIGPAAIHVSAGVITAVTPRAAVPSGVRVVDAGPAVVLPGLVDTHVHINEPGRTEWEGFRTATRAAAAGGVTTVVDMPLNSIPPTTSVAALHVKAAAMEGQCLVDVGLWGGAVPGNGGDLVALLRAGVLGFKCFLVDSGVDEFPPLGEDDLRRALEALAATDAPLLTHAELAGPIARAAATGALPPDAQSYLRYLRSRPKDAEDEAVALLAALAKATSARAHVVHLSSAGALDTLRRAADDGLRLTAETAPHYLCFEAEAIADGATPFKCAPPIREHDNREALWGGLSEGVVGMVVTDHSPCTPELKRLSQGSFDDAWGGIASLQLGLAAMWTEARARGVSLSQVVRWMAEAPAALAGLSGRKGRIAPGHDADLVFFAPEETFTVDAARLQHRHPVTPYGGRTLAGVVHRTMLRGAVVYEGGAFPSAPAGLWLRRKDV